MYIFGQLRFFCSLLDSFSFKTHLLLTRECHFPSSASAQDEVVDWALSGDGVFLSIRCGRSPKIGNRRKCGGFPLVSSFSYVFYLLFLSLLNYCWEVYTLEGGEECEGKKSLLCRRVWVVS